MNVFKPKKETNHIMSNNLITENYPKNTFSLIPLKKCINVSFNIKILHIMIATSTSDQ